MKTMFSLVCEVAAVLLFASCQATTDPKPTTGTLKVRAYSESYTDPTTISASSPIDAILTVTQPDGSSKTMVTDHLGYLEIGTATPGTYTIQPRYLGSSTSQSFVVTAGQTTTGTMLIPQMGIEYYLLNPAKAPTNTKTTRLALAQAISRAAILSSVSSSATVAYSTISPLLSGTGFSSAHALTEAPGQNLSGVTLEILFNTNAAHQTRATMVQTQWQSAGAAVTTTPLVWATFVTTRDTDHNFQVARGGWGFDSNNPLSFYTAQTFLSGDTAYQALLTQAAADLAALSMTAFDSDIVALNDYLIDNALILPVNYT